MGPREHVASPRGDDADRPAPARWDVTLVLLAALALLLGAALAVVLPGNRARAWSALAAQAVAVGLVEVAALPVSFGAPALTATITVGQPIGPVTLRLDALSAFFLVWSLPMTLLGSVYALGYLGPYFARERHVGLHFALLCTTALSFLLVYTLRNGLAFFFGWELAALSAWLLVIWDYPNQKVRFAGFNYLVSTHLSLLLLVGAFMYLHARTGSFDFDAWGGYLSRPGPGRSVVFVLLVGSFGLKSAFFPFHTWLPRAHAAAPAHVSALMSGVIHKAGLYGLLLVTLLMGGRPEPWMGWFVLAFASVSALVGVLYAMTQRDLKRLLGYSSTENVGICGIGCGVGLLGLAWDQPGLAALGFAGGVLHVLNHALFKCLLFYGAGAVYRATHTVDLERLGGLVHRLPRSALLFLIGALGICGLPPLNGFVSELCLYAALLGGPAPTPGARAALIVAAAGLAAVGAVSAVALLRAFGLAFLGSWREGQPGHASEPQAAAGDAPASMLGPMALHAAGVIALGVWPAAALALVAGPVGLLVGPGAPAALDGPLRLLEPVTRLGLALLGASAGLALLRWTALAHGTRAHVTWGCGYTATNARMQYSGTSFSDQLRGLCAWLLPRLERRELPPRGQPFPRGRLQLATHVVDAVERRVLTIIGRGQASADRLNAAAPDDPRASFALGLLLLLAAVAAVLGSAP